MSWGKIYCDTNWGENKYRTAGSIINEATPDCFQFPEFVSFKDHVRTEGATYEQMQCGIDILLFLGRSISITPQSPLNPTFSGILDTYTGATAGYSTRRLTNTYTGGLIRVRRSSDDAEQDIGYDANGEDMDIFGLLAFVNAETTFLNDTFDGSYSYTTVLGSASVTGGVLDFPNTSNTIVFTSLTNTLKTQQVRVTFTILNYVSGSIKFENYNSGAQGTTRSANGTYVEVLTIASSGNNNFGFSGTMQGQIDNFKIEQLTADGHVTTFYDQTGNGNHATNSTASEQPLIVDGGSIIYSGATISRPAIDFDGVDDLLQNTSASIDIADGASLFTVLSEYTSGAAFSANSGSSQTTDEFLLWASSGVQKFRYGRTPSAGVGVTQISNQQIFTGIDDGSASLSIFQNSTTTNSGTSTTVVNTVDLITIGARGASSLVYDGKIQELIFFNSDQSTNRTGIEGNINNYFSIYTP